MTNRDLPKLGDGGRIPRDTFLIRRILTLNEDILYETLEIKNFADVAHELQIEQWSGGSFSDVFEVRGFHRERRGRMLPVEEEVREGSQIVVLQYEGLDNQIRRTFIHKLFNAEKIRVSPALVGYFSKITVPSKGTVCLKSIISFDKVSEGLFCGAPFKQTSTVESMTYLAKEAAQFPFASLKFESDNAILTRSIQNSQTDIFMLLTEEPGGYLYPYAGIPWFSAPFGRDGLITAYQLLPWYPAIAKGVLAYAFQTLGNKMDPFTDEQPGKVFHEMRRGEMANAREVPFIPYYGSVDSTPLALILLHEYITWTRDLDSLREWWPTALRALEWVEKWGDPNGNGFLEYSKQSPTGLVNQGWKDSHDSVMHADGKLAEAPIRLCEVQGYAYRARMNMAALAKLLGYLDLAARLRREALELKFRFWERYWDSSKEFIYLALDGKMEPCQVRSSNMGHCLWSQILTPEQASSVSSMLMSSALFSGHGVRTLSSEEGAYNPLSYHNGSIWPHDNSMILEGFRMYRQHAHVEQLSLALLGVLESSHDFRLPELFCGFRKRGGEPPIPYEVACKPQAWAAGSVFLMLKSMLGISMEVDQDYLVFNSPLLTPKVNYLEIRNLTGRNWEIDLNIRRSRQGTTVEVKRKHGDLRVLTVK